MRQWAQEIRDKIGGGLMSVHIYHGATREKNPRVLKEYDVVVTSYGTAGGEGPPAPKKRKVNTYIAQGKLSINCRTRGNRRTRIC